MLDRFRRITSSGNYMPEIDGLRFIAITSVLLLHAHVWLLHGLGIGDPSSVAGLSTLDPVLKLGGYGVDIFFVISGFILSQPLLQGGKFNYGTYIMRRLTRLEPPYIITTLGFAALLFITGRYTWQEIAPELLTSLVYLNNVITPDDLPLVNGVSWSLEIEVQFYLLCPLIGLWLRKKPWQLIMYVGLLLAALIVQKWFKPEMLTLLSVGSYFVLGYILAYASLRKPVIEIPAWLRDALAAVSFLLIWVLIALVGKDRSGAFGWYLLEHLNLFVFFYLVVVMRALPVIFTNRIVATIGGMCYSIYLLHFGIMSIVGKVLIGRGWFEPSTASYYALMVILLAGTLLVSALFFLWLEKPFMQRDWHKRWWARLRGAPAAGASA
ncbi:MAG TPA: acyltransferase [Flavobacteriales bacterium]|nr:acyltransferase [Flavobacteriales bacterium]